MRDLVFPSTSDKSNSTRYVNGTNHLQKSLTGDSRDQELSSDDESSPDQSSRDKDRIQDVSQGNIPML